MKDNDKDEPYRDSYQELERAAEGSGPARFRSAQTLSMLATLMLSDGWTGRDRRRHRIANDVRALKLFRDYFRNNTPTRPAMNDAGIKVRAAVTALLAEVDAHLKGRREH